MKLNVRGTVMDAPETVEDGRPVGWAPVEAILAAYGIRVRRDEAGRLLLGLRTFADVLGRKNSYVGADDLFYMDAEPLPPLPAEPVGAGIPPWRPVTGEICGGPGNRRADRLLRIIQQFRVATNPRYAKNQQGKDETYCNIFAWDVTKALGCEIPHWVVGNGEPTGGGTGRELDANAVNAWLRSRGPDFGWRRCDAAQAGAAASAGRPAVVSWLNETGIGHIAMIRPGAAHPDRGLPIAQAGGRNWEDRYLWDGFVRGTSPDFFVHD